MNQTTIASPNFTQIPNVIFDYWMPRLSPGAFKILICMCRKIFGWHKTSDTISKNQLMKSIGMSKNSVQSAIEELEKLGLILKFQHQNEYGHQPNTYSLNIQKPLDEIYQELPSGDQNLGGGRSKFDPGVGQNLTQGVGQNLTPQKKDSTKERLTKEITTSPTPKISKEKAPTDEVAIAPGEVNLSSSKNEMSDKAMEVANSMIDILKQNSPVYRPPKVMKSFLETVSLLVDYDKQEPKMILEVLEWAVNDREKRDNFPGWSSVIYGKTGIASLRKNFGMIHGNMISQPKRKFAASSDDRVALADIKAKKGVVL